MRGVDMSGRFCREQEKCYIEQLGYFLRLYGVGGGERNMSVGYFDGGKTKYSKKTLSEVHSVHHKFQ